MSLDPGGAAGAVNCADQPETETELETEMGTEVAKKNAGGALAAVNALKGNLRKVQTEMPETGGSNYMSFLQDGNWVFGVDKEEVDETWQLAINPFDIKTGYNCWSDNKDPKVKNELLGEITVPLGADMPLKSELPDKGFPWKELFVFNLRFLNGPHKGKQVEYKTNSVGGIGACRAVIDQLMIQLDEDEENIVPVVQLDSDHYQHKTYGRTYTPVIDIVDFISMDGEKAVIDEEDDEVDEKPEPKKSRKKAKPEPKPEPEEDEIDEGVGQEPVDEGEGEDEAPTRRRRRRR